MADKRRHRRFKKRLMVTYSEKDTPRSAYTSDVSKGGCFVVTPTLPPLDTRIRLQIHVSPTQSVVIESTVRRHKSVPPELRTIQKAGFGARFLSPEELVAEVLGDKNHFELRYTTPEELKQAYHAELKFGAVFVPTEAQLSRDSEVTVDLNLAFATRVIELNSVVLQVILPTGASSRRGVAVQFTDRTELEAALKPYV
jgi:Tfp pilus assembly protein PilZ